MYKRLAISLSVVLMVSMLSACSSPVEEQQSDPLTTESGAEVTDQSSEFGDGLSVLPERPAVSAPEEVLEWMKTGNKFYVDQGVNGGDISSETRVNTATNGQYPYAVVITCSDSRVPPEHIFSAGIGDLFVIRTAGNVIDAFELGSIEYGAEHLDAPLIVVMGHSGCGAVGAAIGGHAEGNIQAIVDEILLGIGSESDNSTAEDMNIQNSIKRVMESEIVADLVEKGKVQVVGAKYDLNSGEVTFMDSAESASEPATESQAESSQEQSAQDPVVSQVPEASSSSTAAATPEPVAREEGLSEDVDLVDEPANGSATAPNDGPADTLSQLSA